MAALKSILLSQMSKWMKHSLLSRQSSGQEATARHTCIPDIPGWGFAFQQDGALAHRARDTAVFLERKVPDFILPTLWPPNSPDLKPVDQASIWSVLQEKVYRSRIANVNELKRRLIDEWGRFDQSIVDTAKGQWRRRLSAYSHVSMNTNSNKHELSAILSYLPKVIIKLM